MAEKKEKKKSKEKEEVKKICNIQDLAEFSRVFLHKNKRDLGAGIPSVASEYCVGDISTWIPTGVTIIDALLGGGLPTGRVSELYSIDTSEGKTTLALHAAINTQRAGGSVIWLESEAAMDWKRAERLGLDLNKVLLWGPPHLEGGFEFIEQMLDTINSSEDLKDQPILIVWDTISYAQTQDEANGDVYASGMMSTPRIIKRALRRILQRLFRGKAHLLLVSQSYTSPGRFGVTYETSGGKSIKQLSSIRIQLKRIKKNPDPRDPSIETLISTPKNKVAPPFRECPVIIDANRGYNDIMSMAKLFLEADENFDDCIASNGAWYTIGKGTAEELKCYFKDVEERVRACPNILSHWKSRVLDRYPLPPDRATNPDTGWVCPIVDTPEEIIIDDDEGSGDAAPGREPCSPQDSEN